jgi:hypothetical protein
MTIYFDIFPIRHSHNHPTIHCNATYTIEEVLLNEWINTYPSQTYDITDVASFISSHNKDIEKMKTNCLTNSIERGPSWETNSHSPSQKIFHLL